jgi:hypothetical protein
VLCLEDVAACDEAKEDGSKAVDVGARVDVFAPGLLGSHEVGCADDGAARGGVFVGHGGLDDAEVDELYGGAFVADEEDVGEL